MKGEVHYQNGDSYNGEFRDDKRNGYGAYNYHKERVKYSGMWKNNLPHG